MGKLTEQYLSAIQQWANGTGQPVSDIHTYMWLMVGGQGPAPRQEEPSIESGRVPFTLEQTRAFLESTLRRTGFTETFLVVAFIRAIEDRFRVDFALYDKEQVAREQEPPRMRELVSDPEFLKDFQALVNKSNEKARQQGQTIPEIEISTDNLLAVADKMGRLVQRSPVDHLLGDIQAEQALKVWREVTASILEPNNLKESERSDFYRIIASSGV